MMRAARRLFDLAAPTRRRSSATTLLVGAALLVLPTPACLPDGVTFYEVTRTPTEQCDILPQGEFCVSEDELAPPIIELWSVERRGSEVRVFVDDTVWLGTPPREDDPAEQVRAEKQEYVAVDPGPCATSTTKDLDVLATWADVSGTLREKTRLEGPEVCGETPRGERTTSSIAGVAVVAP